LKQHSQKEKSLILYTMARIVGVGQTTLGRFFKSAGSLLKEALESAMADASIDLRMLDGLIAVPSLSVCSPLFIKRLFFS